MEGEKESLVVLSDRLKVVFDCMIYLQAVASGDGPSGICFKKFEQKEFDLFVSVEILNEVADVLSRPKVYSKLKLSYDRIDALIQRVSQEAIFLSQVERIITFDRDPKDEKYLNLAIAAQAEYLISRDLDLLSLMEETNIVGQKLRKSLPNLKIVEPVYFLREVMK